MLGKMRFRLLNIRHKLHGLKGLRVSVLVWLMADRYEHRFFSDDIELQDS
jgi:hypothetical protein